MIRVLATREGLEGHATASGYVIDRTVPFVALPSHHALFRFVRLHNPRNGRKAIAVVLDTGPWNTRDDDYVFQPVTMPNGQAQDPVTRPQAESGTDTTGRHTNGAGIDLGYYVWHALGMEDNTKVDWEFVI